MPAAGEGRVLAFAEQLVQLLEQGRKSATYKFAVVLGLMDLCIEHASAKGEAPQSVTTHQLAQKVLELYWPHSRPFIGCGDEAARDAEEKVLKQSRGGQVEVLSLIERFQRNHKIDASANLARARARSAAAFDKLVREVEWKLVEMPLPKLQRVGGKNYPFIYTINWGDDVKRSEFNSAARFDNNIYFTDDHETGNHLLRLNALLRPLIEAAWTHEVATFNRGTVHELQLEEFLFGRDRISLAPVRGPLDELQSHRCFYCDGSTARGAVQVDHFLPWAKFPTNALENLVVAHDSCNLQKSDHLAAVVHLRRWRQFTAGNAVALDDIAREAEWERAAAATTSASRVLYLRQPQGAPLWLRRAEFVPLDPAELRGL
jgi:5-methylcytosine-specific restriction endonuclease McrA